MILSGIRTRDPWFIGVIMLCAIPLAASGLQTSDLGSIRCSLFAPMTVFPAIFIMPFLSLVIRHDCDVIIHVFVIFNENVIEILLLTMNYWV